MTSIVEPVWLSQDRACAAHSLQESGLPDRRHESWRHTDPRDLLSANVATADEDAIHEAAHGINLPEAAGVLVFVGGRFRPDLSREPPASPGVVAMPLSVALRTIPNEVRDSLGQEIAVHPLETMARERWRDGLFLHAGAGAQPAGPIAVVEIASGASWYRHLVRLEAESSVELIELHLSAGPSRSSIHAATVTRLGRDSRLVHDRLQASGSSDTRWTALFCRASQGAKLESNSWMLGGQIARSEVHVDLTGPRAHARLRSLTALHGEARADLHTAIRHSGPHATSDQECRVLSADASVASFLGTVFVDPGAQGTSARQTNRNLLLGPHASIHARPQLEILADDVKCTHGSATGRLDPQAIAFLRSRGLNESQARRLLVGAFAGEMLAEFESRTGLLTLARTHLENVL